MTDKEQEIIQKILQYIADGCTDYEIAEKINIKYSAVRDNIRRLLFKTGTKNRQHLVSWAYKEGILKI